MIKVTYIDENGTEHANIPGKWNNTSPVNWAYLEGIGWTKREDVIIEDLPDFPGNDEKYAGVEVRYSKRAVREKLIFLGIWDKVKEMLQAGDGALWEELLFSSDLRMSNPNFNRMTEEVGKILPEGVTVKSFLSGCEDKETMNYANRY